MKKNNLKIGERVAKLSAQFVVQRMIQRLGIGAFSMAQKLPIRFQCIWKRLPPQGFCQIGRPWTPNVNADALVVEDQNSRRPFAEIIREKRKKTVQAKKAGRDSLGVSKGPSQTGNGQKGIQRTKRVDDRNSIWGQLVKKLK